MIAGCGGGGSGHCRRVGDGEEQQAADAGGDGGGSVPLLLCSTSPASFCLPLYGLPYQQPHQQLQQLGDFAQAEHVLPVASRGDCVKSKSQEVLTTNETTIFSRAEPSEDTDLSNSIPQSTDDCSEDESADEDGTDPIDVYWQLEDAAELVCLILLRKDGELKMAATGFLVGDRYVMTALHAINSFLVPVKLTSAQAYNHGSMHGKILEMDSSLSVEVNFAFHDNEPIQNVVRVLQRPRAILEAQDVIVLEVSQESHGFPKQGGFRSNAIDFSQPPIATGHVYLIGHNQSSPKRIDLCCKVRDRGYAERQLERYHRAAFASDSRLKHLDLFYHRDVDIVQGGQYVLIDCFFMHGASGCPIFRYCPGDVSGCDLKVVAMFLCGLPTGHYASRPSTSVAEAMAYDDARRAKYKTFEGGISMAAVRASLVQQDVELAVELGWL